MLAKILSSRGFPDLYQTAKISYVKVFQIQASSRTSDRKCFSRRLIAAITILAIVLSAALFADMYKWVDEEGQTHYGDKPPASTKSETLRPPPPVSREEAAKQRERLEKAEREMETRMDERRSKAAVKKAEKLERASIKEQCLALRRELDVLDSGHPVYRDEKGSFRVQWLNDPYRGERRYLDEDERSEEIERVHGEITADCGDPDDPKARRLARAQQIRAERCEAARADLEQLIQPEAKATRGTLDAQRHLVAEYCDNQGTLPTHRSAW